MTKSEALEHIKANYPYDENSDYCAIARIRQKTSILPKYGADGSDRDTAEWAYFDMAGKVDTGIYGDVYYF